MRPLRQDITGTIDSSGNASIPVKLPTTGEWHELKIAASTTGPAEWAILVSGTAITFGRGRRVTLGPELIQDGETVTVTVTGGPRGQAIVGAVTGKSGTPDEMLAAYGPQPNTIALDATSPRQKLFPDGTPVPASALTPSYTVGGAATVTNRFTLPTGTVAVRILANASGLLFTYDLFVGGHQTNEQYWGSPTAPGSPQRVPSPTLPFTIPIEFDWDSQLDLTLVNNSANTINVFVSALFAPETPGQAGAAQSVVAINPAPWQAPSNSVSLRQAPGALNTDFTIVPALGGLTTYLFDVQIQTNAGVTAEVRLWDGPSANGFQVASFFWVVLTAVGTILPIRWFGAGRPLIPGNALVGTIAAGPAGTTAFSTVGYSQG